MENNTPEVVAKELFESGYNKKRPCIELVAFAAKMTHEFINLN